MIDLLGEWLWLSIAVAAFISLLLVSLGKRLLSIMSTDTDDELGIGYFAVAFVDILGQKEKLCRMTNLPSEDSEVEREQLISDIKATYGAVLALRSSFRNFLSTYATRPNYNERIASLPPDKQALFKTLVSQPIETDQFSDFVLASVSFKETAEARAPIRGIYGLIGATATASLNCLARGNPIRGGIELGIGYRTFDGDFYGPVLARAYVLESKTANFPRVVIGEEIYSYIVMTTKLPQTTDINKVNAESALACLKLIAQDDDGINFVDFLGTGVRELILDGAAIEGSAILLSKAKVFVADSLAQYRQQNNDKLTERYEYLERYLEKKSHLWITPDEHLP